MSQGPETTRYHTSEDEHILHKLGYAQELFRAMGGFRNFAISFTIISILAGCLTSYNIGFEHGGPMWVVFGWLLVGLMATIISLGMAEIASAYPTAGGLYYWASKLGSPGWGWATGWFNLIGQVAVTAAIGYGLALFGQALFDFWFSYTEHMNDWFGASFDASTYILYALFLSAAALINLLNIRLTSGLNMISAWWHMIGVVVIVAILIIVPERPPVALVRVHADHQQLGLRRRNDPVRARVPARARAGHAAPAVHDHGVRRVGAHGRGDQQRVADGGDGDVDLRRRLRDLRLDPPRRGDVRDPEQPGGARHGQRPRAARALDLGRVDEPGLGGGAALHLRRRAVLLRDRVRDLGVADDVRLLARRRGAGPSALAARREEPRAEVVGLRHLALRGHPHDPRGLELLRRATRSEPRSRSSASTSPS